MRKGEFKLWQKKFFTMMMRALACWVNPFEIREGLKQQAKDYIFRAVGLNPFEIREGLKPPAEFLAAFPPKS